MKKIERTDDMIFALYKAWKKHYGMHDPRGSKAVLTVSAQTWERGMRKDLSWKGHGALNMKRLLISYSFLLEGKNMKILRQYN